MGAYTGTIVADDLGDTGGQLDFHEDGNRLAKHDTNRVTHNNELDIHYNKFL